MVAIGISIVGTLVMFAIMWVWTNLRASKGLDPVPEMGEDSPRGCLNYIIFVVR